MAGEFKVHRLNDAGLAQAEKIACAFDRLLADLDFIPQGRERALVVTKLQEANFFAKRAVALDPQNQEAASPK